MFTNIMENNIMLNKNKVFIRLNEKEINYIVKKINVKYQNRFTYNKKDSLWYEFKNHRWFKVYDNSLKLELYEIFTNEYFKLLNNKALAINKNNLKTSNEEMIQENSSSLTNNNIFKNKIIKKFVALTKNNIFKNKIIKKIVTLFTDKDFDKKLDENYNLIGFNNGVYDLEAEKFRDGRFDDYISKTTNVDFYEFNMLNPHVTEMFKFFEEILPIKSVRHHMLLSLSSCVSGYNKDEKLRIVTGSGSNGKSLLFKLVQQALGEYYVYCSTISRESLYQLSSEFNCLKSARCACLQDNGEISNVNSIKKLLIMLINQK